MYILYGLLGLGLVVLVHETGHFLAARAVGIEVEVFSIGWGKKLLGFKKGATEYRISMLPLGGFAKMKGDGAYRQALEEGRSKIQPEAHSFFNATPWQRIIVAAAGPAMNLLFAFIFLSGINLVGFNYSSFSNKIILADDFPEYYSLPENVSPAARAGLKTGDRITAVNGRNTENFTMLQREVAPRALETITLSVQRNGEQLSLEADLMLDKEGGSGILGVFPYVEPVIDSFIVPNGANSGAGNEAGSEEPIEQIAAASTLQPGDKIVMFNGLEVRHSYDIQSILGKIPATRERTFVDLTILRENTSITLRQPLFYDEESQSFSLGYSYLIESYRKASGGFFQALADGWNETFATFATTFKGLGLLFRGLNPGSALSGPIRITLLVGEVTAEGLSMGLSEGIRSFFHLLSLLSVALCFGNLLPIPVLDGGQILISMAEIIKRSPISPKAFFRYQSTGAVIVIALLVFILFSDVLFVLGRT